MAMVQSIGDKVKPGTYEVRARGDRLVHFAAGEDIVSVACATAGPGPLRLVWDAGPMPVLGQRLTVSARWVCCGRWGLLLERVPVYDSSLDAAVFKSAELQDNLPLLKYALDWLAPPGSLPMLLREGRLKPIVPHRRDLEPALRRAIQTLADGDLAGALAMLGEMRRGQARAGDDICAGLLLATHVLLRMNRVDEAAIVPALGAALGGEPVGDSAMRLAANGRVSQRVRAILNAMSRSDAARVEKSVEDLVAAEGVGGADFVAGLVMGLESPRGMQALAHGAAAGPWPPAGPRLDPARRPSS